MFQSTISRFNMEGAELHIQVYVTSRPSYERYKVS